MPFLEKAGQVIMYVLLFCGSVVLGYYLISNVKDFCKSKGSGKRSC